MITLWSRLDHFTPSDPASAAPIRPPIRAWEDEDGRPSHQVPRFHAIAPSRPASTISSPSRPWGGLMIPEPTVAATLVDTSAPSTFITAAIASATRGVIARVDTAVAMAFAESWKPLV